MYFVDPIGKNIPRKFGDIGMIVCPILIAGDIVDINAIFLDDEARDERLDVWITLRE